jgi:quercetin dioxygenase-like cupin family protein
MTTTLRPKVLDPAGGLRLQSTPGRDLVFKVTGDDSGGAFDYAVVEVEARNGPPLHVHHRQDEAIHVLVGRFRVRIGEEEFVLERGGFALMPAGIPHAFLNLTDQPAEIVLVYTPGGGDRFFAELGPLTRSGSAGREEIAACFERHDMALLGPPLSAD